METHMNLSKWNPFQFLRRTPDERRSEPHRDLSLRPRSNLSRTSIGSLTMGLVVRAGVSV